MNTLNVKAAVYLGHIVLFILGKITLLILDEESDIFLLIFDAMKKFSANDEVQKLGCKALHVLFERGILKCQILYFYIYIRNLYKKKVYNRKSRI